MNAKCKMSGMRTTWPCPARGCPLFGDCIVEYQRKKAIRQRIGKTISDFRYATGKNPAAILAEPAAFREIVSDEEAVYRDVEGGYRWRIFGTPVRRIDSGKDGVYLIPEEKHILTLSEEGA